MVYINSNCNHLKLQLERLSQRTICKSLGGVGGFALYSCWVPGSKTSGLIFRISNLGQHTSLLSVHVHINLCLYFEKYHNNYFYIENCMLYYMWYALVVIKRNMNKLIVYIIISKPLFARRKTKSGWLKEILGQR